MAKEIEPLDSAQAAIKAGDLLLQSTNLTVDDPLSARKAREMRRDAWLLKNHTEKFFTQAKEPHASVIRALNKQQADIVEPAEMILADLDPKILAWEENEDQRRADLQRELEERARKQTQEARDRLIEDYRQAGNTRAAEEYSKHPIFVPPVILPERADWLDGESRGEEWNVVEETIDLVKLAAAVVSGRLPPSVIEPSWTVLKNMAKTIKNSGEIPGCEIKKFIIIKQRS